MKTRIIRGWRRFRSAMADQSGQALAEYASITTIFLLGSIAAGAAWPFTKALFLGLQTYLDLYFYALNLAVG